MCPAIRFGRFRRLEHQISWPYTGKIGIKTACRHGKSWVVLHSQTPSQRDAEIFLARFCCHGQRHEDREQWYFDLYYPRDERIPRVAQLPDSRLVHITELYTDQELKNSPAYNEALPRGGYQYGLNVRLDGPDGSSIVWTLADSTQRGGWESSQTQMIERLLPHLRQFVRVRHALASAEAANASVIQILDNTRVGVVQLDRRGRIVEANDRARDILQRSDGLSDQKGFLAARLPSDNAKLRRLLGGAADVRRPSQRRLNYHRAIIRIAASHVARQPRGLSSGGVRRRTHRRPGAHY